MGATQKPCRGLDGLQQVAKAVHDAGAECAPALEMPAAPPSSEVSASIGESHTPLMPTAHGAPPPFLAPSSPLQNGLGQSKILVHHMLLFQTTPHSTAFIMQDHTLAHLLAEGLTQILLPLLEATAFKHIKYLHYIHNPSILPCLALPILYVLHLPILGEVHPIHNSPKAVNWVHNSPKVGKCNTFKW